MTTNVQGYELPTDREILDGIRGIIAKTLAIDVLEVHPDSTIFQDLDSESIDMLDFLFRIDQQLGVKIQTGELANLIQGGIPDAEFGNAEGIVNEHGLAQLKKTMPQLDIDSLRGKLRAEQVMNYFTVENLANIVCVFKARA